MGAYDISHQSVGEHADPLNRVFDALRHPYRRRVLRVLAEESRHEEAFKPVDFQLAEADFSTFEIELAHIHLPKLEEAGYITWDKSDNMIWYGERFDEIAPVVELLERNEGELPGDWPSTD